MRSPRLAATVSLGWPQDGQVADRLETAIMPLGTGTAQTYDRIRTTTGATSVRLVLTWAAVAPGAVTKPAGFDAVDHTDPTYRWGRTTLTPPGRRRARRSSRTMCRSATCPRCRTLDAAVRAGNVRSRRPVQFWETEFSWDTSPPDPQAVPMRIHTRWVAEALYRMWENGVTLVTWFSLHDLPMSTSVFQSGLYFHGNRPKPSLAAFRFRFVAIPEEGGQIRVWGRTPAGRPAQVIVEQQFRGGWRRLGVVRTNRNGIFQQRFRGSRPATCARERRRARTRCPSRCVPRPTATSRPSAPSTWSGSSRARARAPAARSARSQTNSSSSSPWKSGMQPEAERAAERAMEPSPRTFGVRDVVPPHG